MYKNKLASPRKFPVAPISPPEATICLMAIPLNKSIPFSSSPALLLPSGHCWTAGVQHTKPLQRLQSAHALGHGPSSAASLFSRSPSHISTVSAGSPSLATPLFQVVQFIS